jgi:hypothetical protein
MILLYISIDTPPTILRYMLRYMLVLTTLITSSPHNFAVGTLRFSSPPLILHYQVYSTQNFDNLKYFYHVLKIFKLPNFIQSLRFP